MAVHPWNVTPAEAVLIQQGLADSLVTEDTPGELKYVAGVDVGFEDRGKVTRAAIAVLEFPSLLLIETAIARMDTSFPYVPGLLSFRELPAVMQALAQLRIRPDLFLCDGQGYAHPRRFGIACHLGVLTDSRTIGVAKTRLIGQFEPVDREKGSWRPLWHNDEIIGAVVRTRSRVKPVFVSIGHRISLQSAVGYVLRCTTHYRLPETTRFAHRYASGK